MNARSRAGKSARCCVARACIHRTWRLARAAGELDGLTPKKRGPKTRDANPLEKENAELRQALAKSEARAKRAEALVELQKKISELLGIAQPKDESL